MKPSSSTSARRTGTPGAYIDLHRSSPRFAMLLMPGLRPTPVDAAHVVGKLRLLQRCLTSSLLPSVPACY